MLSRGLRITFLMLVLSSIWTPVAWSDEDGAERLVLIIQAKGPLTPAMVSYVERAVGIAERREAEVLIFQLDTPGGQGDHMQAIVTALRESRVPVVVYVAPRGAAAWSAGTFITLAGHAAAMAPETGIGAASPVGMDGELGETEERKAKEAVLSLVKGLAARRGEAVVEWAVAAVEDAVAATATEAVELGIVDFLANDLDDLLAQLDGFEVEVKGEPVLLHTTRVRVERIHMSLIERILHVVVNPTIIFTLLGVGVQAILIEISNPGGWVAGFVGIVCIALGIYGLGVLPVNWLGLVFIALAFGLFVMDVKAPTHGALTAAGIGSLVAGALILFNSADAPTYARISVPFVVTFALCFGLFFAFVVAKALQAQKPRPKTGIEGLIGARAEVRVALEPEGIVFLQGERWKAISEEGPIPVGEPVEVVAVEGFCLRVKRIH